MGNKFENETTLASSSTHLFNHHHPTTLHEAFPYYFVCRNKDQLALQLAFKTPIAETALDEENTKGSQAKYLLALGDLLNKLKEYGFCPNQDAYPVLPGKDLLGHFYEGKKFSRRAHATPIIKGNITPYTTHLEVELDAKNFESGVAELEGFLKDKMHIKPREAALPSVFSNESENALTLKKSAC